MSEKPNQNSSLTAISDTPQPISQLDLNASESPESQDNLSGLDELIEQVDQFSNDSSIGNGGKLDDRLALSKNAKSNPPRDARTCLEITRTPLQSGTGKPS